MRGWISAYGITKQTREINGVNKHIERLRGQNSKAMEKVEIEKGGFKFVFRKPSADIKNQARKIAETEKEAEQVRKFEREEKYREMYGDGEEEREYRGCYNKNKTEEDVSTKEKIKIIKDEKVYSKEVE